MLKNAVVRTHRLPLVVGLALATVSCAQQDTAVDVTIGAPHRAPLGAAPEGVARALSDLNSACDAAAAIIDTEREPERLQLEMDRQVGRFWSGLYGASLPTFAVLPNDGHPADALFESAARTDMAVISALFTGTFLSPNTPTAGPQLLLMVLGDAVTALEDRLAASIGVHDFACRFMACKQAMTRSETSELMGILGALPDEQRLRTELRRSTQLRREWAEAFTQVANNHKWLEDAVVHASGATRYNPGLLNNVDPMRTPAHLAHLAAVVRRADAWSSSYARTGLFEPDGLKALYSGIQTGRNEEFKHVVGLRKNELRDAVGRVENDLDRLVQTKRDALRGARDTSLRDSELLQITHEMNHLRSQLKNLRLRITQDEAGFSDRVAAFKSQLDTAQWDRGATQQIGETHHLTISAKSARDDHSDSLSRHAVIANGQVWQQEMAPGDMFQVGVTGQWSPTCALQQAGSGFELESVLGAMAGPEGFQQQSSASGYTLAQVDHSTDYVQTRSRSTTDETSEEVHAGLSFKDIPFTGGLLDIGASASARNSKRSETSSADSERVNTARIEGAESRTSAAFAHGIRSNLTPFPGYPVGSLLLVQSIAGNLVQVDVVRGPHMAVLARGDTATLVVNDLPGCNVPDDVLTVEVVNLRRFASEPMANAMGVVTDFLHARAEALRNDPAIGSTAGVLQSEALTLMNQQGISFATLPSPVQSLFKSWLDKELLNFERKIAAVAIEHQIKSLALRAKGYASDLESSREDARLLTLLPYWSLRNLGTQTLQWKARALTEYILDNYFPVLELFYPEVVDQLRRERLFRLQLNELLHQPWVARPGRDGASVGVLHSLIEAVTMIESKIADLEARRNRPAGTRFQVAAVSYARPDAATRSPWSKGDPIDAQQVWQALKDGGKATVTVRPEHLYSRDTLRPAVLECDMKLPVVRSMGAVFAVPAWADTTALNTYNLPLTPKVGHNLFFPAEKIATAFDLSSAEVDWRKPRLRRFFSATELAEQTFEVHGAPARAGDGLSPFTTFEFEFPTPSQVGCDTWADCAAGAAMEHATEMIIFFELETRATEEPMRWIPTCQ